MKTPDERDRDYTEGHRAACRMMLGYCLRELLGLDADDKLALLATKAQEIDETRAMLRRVCEDHGDNDWPDDLHLADVVEKHLWRHLETK